MSVLAWLSGGNRGVALIMVLWVLTVLALLAASFSSTTRTEVNLARNIVESSKAAALAEAGVHQAILGLTGSGSEEAWRVDGTVYAWRLGGGEIRVAVEDEGAKIDLNAARDQILLKLFLALEFEDADGNVVSLDLPQAQEISDAIQDFRDPDDLVRPSGAEDGDYRLADLNYDAKDQPFESVEELQQVYGMTREIYLLAAPALTVHARRRRPFTATASDLVRAALEGGLGDAGGEASPELEIEDDSDVVPLEEISEVPQIIEKGPSPERSRVPIYTIHAEGRSAGGAVFALDAITRLTRDEDLPYVFLGWKRGDRRLFDSAADEDELALEE